MKVWYWKVNNMRPDKEYNLDAKWFNELVENGYDLIVIVGPTYRLMSTIDDWLDFGNYSADDTEYEFITLKTNRMEKS